MNEHIYKIPVGGNYVKYEVNIVTLQDRERDCEGGWTKWRDMCSLSFGFYKVVEPEIFDNRNKLVHNLTENERREQR